jgi:hypothetical protein
MRPIAFVFNSVNQRLPSGPAVTAEGPLLAVGIENVLMLPPVVIRPKFRHLPPLQSLHECNDGA